MNKEKKTAKDLLAELERSPSFRARAEENERERLAKAAASRQAAAPIVRELVDAGLSVSSLTDLRTSGIEYVAAIPILLDWLARVENVDVKQDVVRCLSVPFAKPAAASPLIQEFRRATTEEIRWTVGNALEVVADPAVSEDLIEIARDRRYGKAREMVVVSLGKLNDPNVVNVLLELLKDDVVRGHAIIALGKLRPPAARAQLEPFLKDAKPWIRKEAKKALAAIDKAKGRLI